MDRMTSSLRQTAWFPVRPPMGGSDGLEDICTGVMCSLVGTDVGGAGIDSGAKAAWTRASGLGKRTAISGARGRDSMYDPREPVAVMTVRRANAAVGSSTDPTRMFCSSAMYHSANRSAYQDDSTWYTPGVFPTSHKGQDGNRMVPPGLT
jgi:hypothetical protein